jgi:hypothetical protein
VWSFLVTVTTSTICILRTTCLCYLLVWLGVINQPGQHVCIWIIPLQPGKCIDLSFCWIANNVWDDHLELSVGMLSASLTHREPVTVQFNRIQQMEEWWNNIAGCIGSNALHMNINNILFFGLLAGDELQCVNIVAAHCKSSLDCSSHNKWRMCLLIFISSSYTNHKLHQHCWSQKFTWRFHQWLLLLVRQFVYSLDKLSKRPSKDEASVNLE